MQNNKLEIKKEIGVIGLGKMGANLAKRLVGKSWNIVGYNRTENETKTLEKEGVVGAYSYKELVEKLPEVKTLWLMVPHFAVDEVIDALLPFLKKGDTIIDGGNSPYKSSIERGEKLAENGINFLDAGVSGGPEGALKGSCIMVGGKKDLYEKYENLFKDLAVEKGYGHVGESGAGHFVKMVHNGIEYGMMQAIAEGFNVMKNSKFDLNMNQVSEIYNHGSVITSSLINWLSQAYRKFGEDLLDETEECCSASVDHSGEGQWTVDAARELNIPVAIIEGALNFRKESKENPSYTGRIVSAMRHQFGGHDTTINKNKNK